MFCAYVVLGLCNVSFHMESVLKFFKQCVWYYKVWQSLCRVADFLYLCAHEVLCAYCVRL